MGMDASLYFTSSKRYSEQELKKLNYRFMEACSYGDGNNPITEEIYNNIVIYHVSSMSRYYGIGYERGDFQQIYMAFIWLKHNIEDCKLFYGGDSFFDECYEMDDEGMSDLLNRWVTVGGVPYSQRTSTEERYKVACDNCKEIMSVSMLHGESGRGLLCLGCRKYIITEDGGITWEEKSNN